MFETVEVAHEPADLLVAGQLLVRLERVRVTVDADWADLVDETDGPAGADDDPDFEWPDDADWLADPPALGELFAADAELDLVEAVQPAPEIGDLDDEEVLQRLAAGQLAVNRAEADQLALAARWADLHAALISPTPVPGGETLVRPGGDGTPRVAEFCRVELAAMLAISQTAAGKLIADALDLRHRLPRLWVRVQAGQVKVWVARMIATRTRKLSQAACGTVDRTIAPIADTVIVGRLLRSVEAAILRADPDQAKADTETAANEKGVWFGRKGDHGHGTIFGRAPVPDLQALNATLDRFARHLSVLGDTDSYHTRRATALGILADPAAALEVTRLANEALAGASPASKSPVGASPARQRPAGAGPTNQGQTGASRAGDGGSPAGSAGPHDGTDPRRGCDLGRAVLYVHVTQQALAEAVTGAGASAFGVARVEEVGPVLLDQVRDWLGHRQVKLTKVIDIPGIPPVDRYEVPDRMVEAIRLRTSADCSPYSPNTSRIGQSDHTRPYVPIDQGGPPGQTHVANLGRLGQFNHRWKTHGRWKVTQPRSGAWIWKSPHGRYYLVDHGGTTPLGRL